MSEIELDDNKRNWCYRCQSPTSVCPCLLKLTSKNAYITELLHEHEADRAVIEALVNELNVQHTKEREWKSHDSISCGTCFAISLAKSRLAQ